MNQHEVEKNSVEVPDDLSVPSGSFSWKKLWAFSGPGILMSIAYLDPGNLESDLQSGAQGGYSLLWVLLWSTVIGNILQILSARLGVVTGKNLAEVCRAEFPRWVSLKLWLMTEIAIISSDIQEVIGSAVAMKILFGLPLWAGVLVTALDTFTFLIISYYGVRKLELFFAFLVSIMAVSFAVCFGISSPDFSGILKGTIVPSCSSDVVVQAVGTLGAVIMPHNLYLHSALVQSRSIDRSNRLAVQESNFYNAIESSCSLFVSFIINACVVSVFSAGFFGTAGASDIGLEQAGDVLGVRYGDAVRYIWAIGLLAAGQSSTMTGTLAGQYVMQGFLDINVSPWVRVMITRSIAIVPAVIVAISSTSNLNTLDELLNVIQSLQLPFALLPLLLFCANPILMQEFIIGIKMKFFVWPLFFAVLGINVYLVQDFASRKIETNPGTVLGYVAFSFMYFGSMVYLVYWEFWAKHRGIEVNEIGAAEQSPIHSRKAMGEDTKYFRLSEEVKL